MKNVLTNLSVLSGLLLNAYVLPVNAADIDQKVSAAATVNKTKSYSGPINILTNDPLVNEILNKQKQFELQKKTQAAINANTVVGSSESRKQAKTRTETITLELPEQQPVVVNRTKQFVIKDLTDRNTSLASPATNLSQRMNQIERLRQMAR